MPLPSSLLLGLLALASLLHLVDLRVALGVDGLLLAASALDWWATGGGRRPRITRSAPSRVRRGGTGQVTLEVTTTGARRTRVRLTDDLPECLARQGPERMEVVVDPGAPAVITYGIRAVARGPASLGDVHVRVLGPLGLAWRQQRVREHQPVRIPPAVPEASRARLTGLRRRLREVGLRNTRQRGEGRAFESLRPYIRGDDPRAIDWKATARHGETLVRQYEAERSQHVVVALDLGRGMLETVGEHDRLDLAMGAALLLADVARAHGDRVGALLFADRVQQFLPPRPLSASRLADVLASAAPRMVEPNYPLAFATLLRQVRRRALVVLFTDVVDPMVSSALLEQVARSRDRHLVLTVALRNPELSALAERPADSLEGAYRRAAAEHMLQARSVALRAMRRTGALVIEPDPSELVTEVVNRYLDVKYRALL